eukprot:TRINITY_DN764_c0_g1_i1.p1 TRINITY_DN764_c0_g1~~TRINITY_DN764_c0_g1_i1.p1  ORF type:complete len:171 (+),score=57.32 TRINITY_DN764_c0_g1_i1:64-576(+)
MQMNTFMTAGEDDSILEEHSGNTFKNFMMPTMMEDPNRKTGLEIEVVQPNLLAEPEEDFPAYREWFEKHEEDIAAKRRSEDQKLEEAKEEARAKLKKFHVDRLSKIEQNKLRNKEEQEAKVEDMENTMKSGTEWSRVTALIDTKSISTSEKEKDKGRMRELLIKLSYDKS